MPIAIKMFLSKYWPYIALGVMLFLLYLACQYILKQQYEGGYNACVSDVAEAKALADEETRKAQAEIQLKSQEEENEIRKIEGADAPASPYMRAVLKRLQQAN